MIYFIQPFGGGPVKIGYSADVPRRQIQLESEYGQRLILLATRDGDRKTEAAIHAQFAHLRFERTEQFKPATDLMAFIGLPLLAHPDPDAVEAMIPRKVSAFGIRSFEEWKDWVQRMADKERVGVSDLVDRALALYAEHIQFDPPPKR